MKTLRRYLPILALTIMGTTLLFAQNDPPKSDGKVHVMVVGTYHMDNPGRDMYNVAADDVLTPQRQKEVAEVIEVLKKFRPTKIMIEASDDGKAQARYDDYVAGKYTLTRNEIDQLGFRLAKELGHKQIYPVDVQYRFRADEMIAFAKKSGQEPALNAMFSEAQKAVGSINDHLKHSTILNTLRFVNSDEQVTVGQNFYMVAAHMNSKDEHPGDDLLTDWYERNIRIFSNIVRESQPGDRVLVLYGSGHAYWLQRDVLDSPDMVLEKFE